MYRSVLQVLLKSYRSPGGRFEPERRLLLKQGVGSGDNRSRCSLCPQCLCGGRRRSSLGSPCWVCPRHLFLDSAACPAGQALKVLQGRSAVDQQSAARADRASTPASAGFHGSLDQADQRSTAPHVDLGGGSYEVAPDERDPIGKGQVSSSPPSFSLDVRQRDDQTEATQPTPLRSFFK